jgi:hypothetical protein
MVEILSEDYKHSGLSAKENHYGWKRNYSGRENDVSAGGIVFLCGADYLPDSFARVAQTADAPRVERDRRETDRARALDIVVLSLLLISLVIQF